MKDLVHDAMEAFDAGIYGTLGVSWQKLSSVSQLRVWPFFYFDFCGCPHGILGSCPFECLHFYLLGLLKYLLEHVFEMLDLPADFLRWYRGEN